MVKTAAKKEEKAGKMSFQDIQNLINKKAGQEVSFSLKDKNPTDVKEWISTGSEWLDNIICKGKRGGIPIGKVSKIAGLSSTGKSYLAIQIAMNAQKMGIPVYYFDSESAIDSQFLIDSGVDLDKFHYIQAITVEFVLETVEMLMANSEEKMLFIWDSLANTVCKAELELDFNPNATVGLKARILSGAFKKLDIPLANSQCTFLILNQLKFKIPKSGDQNEKIQAMIDPYSEPGGLSPEYNASLNLRLVNRKSKGSFVLDANGFKIGSEVKVKINKSRFGSDGRECAFKILWGANQVKIMDEESWVEPVSRSSKWHQAGAWVTLDGYSKKFTPGQWGELIKDPEFVKVVKSIMHEELVVKFDKREGDANKFYNVDPETEEVPADEEVADE